MYKLQLNNINISYHSLKGETKALKDISFNLNEGDFLCIVGPSGCGKSTLLNIIAGLLSPSYGDVLLDGKPQNTISYKIGYMFQKDNLFDWLTVYDNVALGLKINHKLTTESKNNIESLLLKYGLLDFKNHYPRELSGGMRQRVALLRTLVMNPEILLLDEPFSALDYQSRLKVNDDIAEIIKNENKTALMVTHDISEAVAMSNRILLLSKRPATVMMELPIVFKETYDSPLKRRESEDFRKYFNIIWRELDEGNE